MIIKKIPKGEMCLSCIHLLRKCNHLPFNDMRPMSKPDKEGYLMVVCTDFKRIKEPEE